jgi:sugar phosphate isomerase/epimerase
VTLIYGVKFEPADVGGEAFAAAYGRPKEFFAKARAAGAKFVEMACVRDVPLPEVLSLGREAIAAGLWVSLHPYLLTLLELGEQLGRAAGEPVPMVFHGGDGGRPPHFVPQPEAALAASAFFRWAGAQARGVYHNVRVRCETQYPAPAGDPHALALGQTYRSCMDLVEGTGARVCWDFGHTLASARRGLHAATPPAEFLPRVGHVHLHDAQEIDGRLADHRPLGAGLCPWRENLASLKQAGFAGWILFEVTPRYLGGYRALEEMLAFGIAGAEAIFRKS